MARHDPDRIRSLVLDPGVLDDAPVLEIYGWRGVARHGGAAVTPLRRDALTAERSGVPPLPTLDELDDRLFEQAVVHLQKGRDATRAGLAAAWRRLELGGRLLLVGGNDLGVKSAAARLAHEVGSGGEVVANRARGRAVAFERGAGDGPGGAVAPGIRVEAGDDGFTLRSAPGVFSADELDPGSRLLLSRLDTVATARRILDPGCGLGVLGLAALRRFPDAAATLADADARAVAAAGRNAADLGLGDRCRCRWWDAALEPPPEGPFDLVVCNPPFHRGVDVDLDVPRAMFRGIGEVLAPGGTALVVALRTLPFERDLAALGTLDLTAEDAGYKVLRVRR